MELDPMQMYLGRYRKLTTFFDQSARGCESEPAFCTSKGKPWAIWAEFSNQGVGVEFGLRDSRNGAARSSLLTHEDACQYVLIGDEARGLLTKANTQHITPLQNPTDTHIS